MRSPLDVWPLRRDESARVNRKQEGDPPPPFLRASASRARPSTRMPGRKRERNKTHPGQPRRPRNSLPHLADQDKATAASPYRHCDAQTKASPQLVELRQRRRGTPRPTPPKHPTRERSQGLTRDAKAVVGTRRRWVLEEVDSAGAQSNREAGGRRAPEKKRAKDQASEKATRKRPRERDP